MDEEEGGRPPASGCKACASLEANLLQLQPALAGRLEQYITNELRSVNDKLDRILEQSAANGSMASAARETERGNPSLWLPSPSSRKPTHEHKPFQSTMSEVGSRPSLDDVLAFPEITSGWKPRVTLRSSMMRSSAITAGSSHPSSNDTPGPPASSASTSPKLGMVPEGVTETSSEKTFRSYGTKDLERAEEILSQPLGGPLTVAQSAWEFLEVPESSLCAWAFATVTPIFILATVALTLAQTHELSPLHGVLAAALETAIDIAFLLEWVVRLVCCPNPRVFFLSFYNIIDTLAAAPLVVRAASGFVLPTGPVERVPHAILFCVVPIVRLLKILRRFESFHLLLRAFRLAAEALPVMLFILSILALTFSMLIYLAEPRDNVASIPLSMWFVIVTMSTVGYGDVTPESTLGRLIAGTLIVITALYMAIPIGIVGKAFSDTWEERDKILLMHRTRDRLRQRGFSAMDIPALFHVAAEGREGTLNIQDFRRLLLRMGLGLSEERILKLFQSFDTDNSGAVDDREFVRHLFPNAYHDIYDDKTDPEEEILSQISDCDFGDSASLPLSPPPPPIPTRPQTRARATAAVPVVKDSEYSSKWSRGVERDMNYM